MKKLIERFSGLVKGTFISFDRIDFKGFILPLMSAEGAMKFCGYNNILNNDYKKWVMEKSKCLIEAANQYGKDNCGRGIIPISTWRIRKEALAHKRQIDEKIENGLIGICPVWSRLPRIVLVIVKDSDTRCFLCWERQEKTRSGKIGRRIIQENWATKTWRIGKPIFQYVWHKKS